MKHSFLKFMKESYLVKLKKTFWGYAFSTLFAAENSFLLFHFALKMGIAPALIAGVILSVTAMFIISNVLVLCDKVNRSFLLVRIYQKNILGFIRKDKSIKKRMNSIADLTLPDNIKMNYMRLAKNIVYATSVTKKNIVAVSSVNPDEGKTTTSANLGIYLAKEGYKTLLIDSDLRKPSQHLVFAVENKVGYSDFCIRKCTIEECIHKNVANNLDLLTCGFAPPNTDELLSQEFVIREIEKFSKKYDYIIIDLPPFRISKDIIYYKNIIAGLMIVIKHKSTKYFEICRFMKWIEKNNIHFLGFVLNQFEHSKIKQTK